MGNCEEGSRLWSEYYKAACKNNLKSDAIENWNKHCADCPTCGKKRSDIKKVDTAVYMPAIDYWWKRDNGSPDDAGWYD